MTISKKRLIIMAACVAAMALLLVLLTADYSSCSGKNDDSQSMGFGHSYLTEPSQTDADGEADTLLIDLDSDSVQSVRVKNPKGTYTIRRGENGLLGIEELSGLPLNDSYVEILWYAAISVGYDLVIPPRNGLAEFGLDNPETVVDIVCTDGSTHKMSVGSGVPGGESSYYITVDDYTNVFSTYLDFSFFQGDTYWLSDEIFTGESEGEITKIALSGSAFSGSCVIEKNNAQNKADDWYGYSYIFTSPAVLPTDKYNMSLLIDELTDLTADDTVCARPTEEEIAKYGIDRPYAVLTRTCGGKSTTLRLARQDASTIYLMVDGINAVYKLNAESYQMLAALSTDALRGDEVHVVYFETVAEMSVKTQSGEYTFRNERTPLEYDNTLFEYHQFCGGAELTSSWYKNLLEVFNGASAASIDQSAESGEPYMTVRIRYFDSFGKFDDVFEYYECANRRFLCRRNGKDVAVVTSLWLEAFAQDAADLAAGKSVTP